MKKSSMQNELSGKQSYRIPIPFLWAGCLLSLLAGSGILQAAKVDKIAAGGSHSLILKTDGSLWAVGSNSNGQLGDGSTSPRSVPYMVESSNVLEIAAGENHSLYIFNDNGTIRLKGMGANTSGQLGDGTSADQHSPVSIDDGDIFSVSADGNHSLYLKVNTTKLS